MTAAQWLPVFVVLSSLLPGIVIFLLREEAYWARTLLNLTGAVLKLALVAVMAVGVFQGQTYEARFPLFAGQDLALHAAPLSLLFVVLSSVLWLVTTLYAIGYLESSPHRSRFFGFFSLCVSATTGIAMAANLLSFVLFYEMLTLATYPLVVHRGTPEALRAGRVYLGYTLAGGALLLLGAIWLTALAGPVNFAEAGSLANVPPSARGVLPVIFVLLIAGLGVKASLVPLHSWLPIAMIAPAPVSALLHAVAVVKAGAFGIVRVVYDVFGVRLSAELGLLGPLAVLASLTILYGSIMALRQTDLKRRLAFSTISQVSYIVLGTSIVGAFATTGGLVHIVHQGIMKITLFFCAGNFAETVGITDVRRMHGLGRRMPLTAAAFTVAALGMIGIPPLAGFISKWYLGLGALEGGSPWAIVILLVSTLLNAAYFLPIVNDMWFRSRPEPWDERLPRGRLETRWLLLAPPVVMAVLVAAAGILAEVPMSPLEWSRLITGLEYGR